MIPPDQWTIDPAATLIVRFTYPERYATDESSAWVSQRFHWGNVIGLNIKGVEPARNRAVRDYILKAPARFTDVILMDRDVRPNELSDFFLTLDTDLASCTCKSEDPRIWANPRAFHLPLCRVRRKVFETIEAPWFMRPLAPDGCAYQGCECNFFLQKALAAGFTSSHAGWSEHDGSGHSMG
jgi:hypothetical protein